jgi:hypothetical protein
MTDLHWPHRRPTRPLARAAGPTLIALLTGLLAHAAAADSLRCNGRLIEVGDPKARLVAECGQPLSREVVEVIRAYDDGQQVRSLYAEEWAYETAGAEKHQVLRFEGGRLVGEGMRCAGKLVVEGDSTVTVLKRCGEPVTRDTAGLVHDAPGPASRSVVSDSPVEQWVYSQGKGTLLKIVLLRGGTIERIEDGARQ